MPQSFSNVPIHLVFSTKNRQLLISGDRERELYGYISGILRNLNCQMIRAGGVEDHIHILFRIARTISIAHVVEKVKSGSTKWVRPTWNLPSFEWQNGYGSFGVGIHDIDTVVAYIENQKEHHKKVSFKEEFLQLLQEHDLEWDERYIWD